MISKGRNLKNVDKTWLGENFKFYFFIGRSLATPPISFAINI